VVILGDLDTVTGLEKELSNAKEELKLMAKKERESQVSSFTVLYI
jgi:myomegalin